MPEIETGMVKYYNINYLYVYVDNFYAVNLISVPEDKKATPSALSKGKELVDFPRTATLSPTVIARRRDRSVRPLASSYRPKCMLRIPAYYLAILTNIIKRH